MTICFESTDGSPESGAGRLDVDVRRQELGAVRFISFNC